MKALVFKGEKAQVAETTEPRLRPGWAKVQVLLSGICNTDLELLRGYHGFSGIPGHEFVGRVVSPARRPEPLGGRPARRPEPLGGRPGRYAGPPAKASGRQAGRRVVGEINLACGRCSWCAADLGRHCPRRKVLGIIAHPGAHAEFLTLPETNLHPVPDNVSDEQAVFVEPLAAACEILEQLSSVRDRKTAVLGDGKLGLLVAQVLAHAGAEVTVLGKHRGKLALARRLGLAALPSRRAPRRAFDLVVEATGARQGLPLALELARPRGTIVMKSTFHGLARFDAAPLVVNEVTVVGSRCGRFAPALDLLARGAVNVEALVSDEFPLARASAALRHAARPGVLKVFLRP